MPDSLPKVYLHFVWGTKQRQPLITPQTERDLYRLIHSQVATLGCQAVALGGIEDHVHLLVRYGRGVSFGQFMNRVKGGSSRGINARHHADLTPGDPGCFRWQQGYGVFGVGNNQTERAAEYIVNQKQHHAGGTLFHDWETWDSSDAQDTANDENLT